MGEYLAIMLGIREPTEPTWVVASDHVCLTLEENVGNTCDNLGYTGEKTYLDVCTGRTLAQAVPLANAQIQLVGQSVDQLRRQRRRTGHHHA